MCSLYEEAHLRDRMVTEIEYVLDLSIEDIRNLVAAGWTLQPPDKNGMSLADAVDNLI